LCEGESLGGGLPFSPDRTTDKVDSVSKNIYDIDISKLDSAVARRLVALGPRRGLRIGAHPVVIMLCELVVVTAGVYGEASPEEFLDDLAAAFEGKDSLFESIDLTEDALEEFKKL